MTKPIPYVQSGKLHSPAGEIILSLPAAAKRTGWADWLGNPAHRSFRFVGLAGATCTVIKERRKQRSGEVREYWYCHRQVLGTLKRVYLGKPESVTLAALEAAAAKLAQLELGEGVEGEDLFLEVDAMAERRRRDGAAKQGLLL